MSMKVLIVDDNDSVRKLLRDLCLEAGHTAVLANTGQEAWELLDRGEEFELIISDNDMPEMTGVELLQRVRGGSRTADIPFILMSGNRVVSDNDPTLLEEICTELGAMFLPKPFSIHALFSVLGVGVELCD